MKMQTKYNNEHEGDSDVRGRAVKKKKEKQQKKKQKRKHIVTNNVSLKTQTIPTYEEEIRNEEEERRQ